MVSSYAPEKILEVRRYLKPLTGLSDIELGIVNNETDASYHHGWSQRDTDGTDYSWDESSRDWSHKTDAARALDVGMFDRLREMSVWMVGQCEAGAADCADIREIIYSPDGKVVKRWDRLGVRTSGSLSHTTHTHFSWFADAEYRRKVGPFKRFFEGDNMGYEQADRNVAEADTWRLLTILENRAAAQYQLAGEPGPRNEPNLLKAQLDRIEEALGSCCAGGLTEDRLRAIIREEIAKTTLS